MAKLKAVAPQAVEPSKPKILIYGRPGVGKTFGALDFPNCYYCDTEGGANLEHYIQKLKKSGGVYFGPEQGSQDFASVIEEVKSLATENHNYKTLVIDSISKIFNSEITDEYEKMRHAGRDLAKTFGAEKKPAVKLQSSLMQWVEKIDMNVVLVAHEKQEWANDKVVGTTFDCHEKMGYELHLALNIMKMGDSRKAFIKKSRLLGFPEGQSFDWGYDEFSKRYGKEVIERASTQLIIATQAQLKELAELLEVVKLPEGLTDKWLKAASVSDFSDMETTKLDGCLAYLHKLLKSTETKGKAA